MERLFDSDAVNTQFLHALVCEDYEKNMIDEILQKKIMNGSVCDSVDLPVQREIQQEIDRLVSVFYNGDKLTDFEKDVERLYLANKLKKHSKYETRKSNRFKVKWTISDLNRY